MDDIIYDVRKTNRKRDSHTYRHSRSRCTAPNVAFLVTEDADDPRIGSNEPLTTLPIVPAQGRPGGWSPTNLFSLDTRQQWRAIEKEHSGDHYLGAYLGRCVLGKHSLPQPQRRAKSPDTPPTKTTIIRGRKGRVVKEKRARGKRGCRSRSNEKGDRRVWRTECDDSPYLPDGTWQEGYLCDHCRALKELSTLKVVVLDRTAINKSKAPAAWKNDHPWERLESQMICRTTKRRYRFHELAGKSKPDTPARVHRRRRQLSE